MRFFYLALAIGFIFACSKNRNISETEMEMASAKGDTSWVVIDTCVSGISDSVRVRIIVTTEYWIDSLGVLHSEASIERNAQAAFAYQTTYFLADDIYDTATNSFEIPTTGTYWWV